MKNLLIFIHPSKTFKDYYREMDFLVKVQVDNSLAFGWKREDIMMVTNFPYEYNGVRTIVVSDDVFSKKKKTVSKINAILALFAMGMITDDLYWFHDFDAFQNASLGEISLGYKELALTHTSVNDARLSTGVMFFSEAAKNLFTALQAACQEYQTNEERALKMMINKDASILEKLLVLNIGHNFAIRKRPVAEQYLAADKPIKVLHFHPFDNRFCDSEPEKSSLAVVYGNNSFNQSLIGETLRESFLHHGITSV